MNNERRIYKGNNEGDASSAMCAMLADLLITDHTDELSFGGWLKHEFLPKHSLLASAIQSNDANTLSSVEWILEALMAAFHAGGYAAMYKTLAGDAVIHSVTVGTRQ